MRYATFLVALLLAVPVYAQVDLGPSLFLAVSPPYPKPNENVTLTIQNPLVDLSQRIITWKNAGTVVLTGEGETVYRVQAPAAGEKINMSVSVEGLSDTATVTIAPSGVDLMWESDSYTPGLYRGRHLPSLGSSITLQALPHIAKNGVDLTNAQLIFSWYQDGKPLASGKGKASITVPVAAFVDTSSVTVNVTSADKLLGAEKSVSITASQPSVRLYFEHPLYGVMYHSALPTHSDISDTEMTFAAIPYFAEADGPNDRQFSYIWRVNKTAVESNSEHPNTLVINAGDAGGDARIELSLTHKKNFQLDAHGTWDVTFGSIAGERGSSDLFTGQ